MTVLTSAGGGKYTISLQEKHYSLFLFKLNVYAFVLVHFEFIYLMFPALVTKRSRLPGVTITQYASTIPEGESTPDFQSKAAPVTVEEGERR